MGAFDLFFDVFQCDQSVAHERAGNSDPLDKNLGYQKKIDSKQAQNGNKFN